MNKMTAMLTLAIGLNTTDAMASAMAWNCEGAFSKLHGTSAFMSVQLHSADLSIEQENIHFDRKLRDSNTDIQLFVLEKYTVLFLPQSTFVDSDDNIAKALVVVFRKGQGSNVTSGSALDFLSCIGR